MKITEVNVNVGMTLNIGNYESVRVDAEARVSLDKPGDTVADAYKMAWETAEAEVKSKAKEVKGKVKK